VIFDGDNIFIDLSVDFVNRFTEDYDLARLVIFSIVNTLIAEFPVNRVHFMIDTRQWETFHGVEDFHLAFERDDTLLLSYIRERAAEEAAWEDSQ
jgi:hypothetical protein